MPLSVSRVRIPVAFVRRAGSTLRRLSVLCAAASAAGAQRAATPAPRSDTLAQMAGAPRHRGTATLVEEMAIGQLTGSPEYMLGEVADLAVTRDGTLYVYDRSVPALRQYDASGRYVRTLGRRGQGPGEYLDPGGIGVLPDGRVVVWDTGNWRINVYAPTGESIGQWSTPSGATGSASMSTSRALMVDTAGNVYYRRTLFTPEPSAVRTVVIIRLRPDGTPIDTIPAPRPGGDTPRLTAASGGVTIDAPVPFSPTPHWALSPLGYFVTGVANRFAFELLIPPADHGAGSSMWHPGEPVISIRREVAPTPVSGHERDSARTAMEERMRRSVPGWSWNGPDIPATKPYYWDIVLGADGRIWLPIIPVTAPRPGGVNGLNSNVGRGAPQPQMSRMGAPPDAPSARSLWDVFEPSGVYVGRVRMPARMAPIVMRGDSVWGVAFDEDDVQSVKRYRIAWP
jgi:6-bladed beta-propeller